MSLVCEGFLDEFAKKYHEALSSGRIAACSALCHYGTSLHGADLRSSELAQWHSCLDFLGRSDPAGVVVSALSSHKPIHLLESVFESMGVHSVHTAGLPLPSSVLVALPLT